MSRRHRAEKREINPDPKFNDLVVSKFMNSIMREGKKSVAERIVYGALDRMQSRAKSNPIQLFGNGSGTINGFASGTGVTLPVGFVGDVFCPVAGTLQIKNLPTFTTNEAYNTNTATSGTTLTGANISGGIIEVTLAMTGTMSGDANAQLPTVANLVAAIPNAIAGMVYKLHILNESSANHTWTITTNTGWTLTGTLFTIAQNTSRDFYVTLTTLSAATLQSIGTGSFS